MRLVASNSITRSEDKRSPYPFSLICARIQPASSTFDLMMPPDFATLSFSVGALGGNFRLRLHYDNISNCLVAEPRDQVRVSVCG